MISRTRTEWNAVWQRLGERDRERLVAYARTSPSSRFQRDPAWERKAEQLLARTGMDRGLKPGESRGAALVNILRNLSDPANAAMFKRAAGLAPGASQADMYSKVLELAPELANTPSELGKVIGQIEQNDITDDLVFKRYESDTQVAQRETPALDDNATSRAHDEQHRRNLVENAWREAEQRPLAPGRRPALYDPPNSRALDVAVAMASHEGKVLKVDPSSQGAKEWIAESGGDNLEAIRASAEVTQEATRQETIRDAVNQASANDGSGDE